MADLPGLIFLIFVFGFIACFVAASCKEDALKERLYNECMEERPEYECYNLIKKRSHTHTVIKNHR